MLFVLIPPIKLLRNLRIRITSTSTHHIHSRWLFAMKTPGNNLGVQSGKFSKQAIDKEGSTWTVYTVQRVRADARTYIEDVRGYIELSGIWVTFTGQYRKFVVGGRDRSRLINFGKLPEEPSWKDQSRRIFHGSHGREVETRNIKLSSRLWISPSRKDALHKLCLIHWELTFH